MYKERLRREKREHIFQFFYKQKCFLCVEKSNTKKKKDNTSCSKKDCQSCGKSVCRKYALRIVSIVITMQISFIETLDLEIYQYRFFNAILTWFILL